MKSLEDKIDALTRAIEHDKRYQESVPSSTHLRHHQWLEREITRGEDDRRAVRDAVLKWGIPLVLWGVAWALWQAFKDKLGLSGN